MYVKVFSQVGIVWQKAWLKHITLDIYLQYLIFIGETNKRVLANAASQNNW